MAQGINSELFEALLAVIHHTTPGKRGRKYSEKRIGDLLSGVSPSDQDRALIQWLDDEILLRATQTSAPETSLLSALSRFGRAYSHVRDRNRLGREREEADGCFERVSESRRNAAREWIGFVPLFRNGRLGELSIIGEGNRSRVSLDYADLFQALLYLRPEGFYLIHNHPSGDLEPSREDRILTFEVQSIAHDLKLKFLGHGIVSTLGNHWIVV